MIWAIVIAAGAPVQAQEQTDVVPATFSACVEATRAGAANVNRICDTSGYKEDLWGPLPSYRPGCLAAMVAGPKWVEARKAMPPGTDVGYRKNFEDAYDACVHPAAPPPALPIRKTTKLWD